MRTQLLLEGEIDTIIIIIINQVFLVRLSNKRRKSALQLITSTKKFSFEMSFKSSKRQCLILQRN